MTAMTAIFTAHWKDLLVAFGMSMLPVAEVRGGIIYAALREVPFALAAIVCFAGNVLPVPFVLLFLRRIMHFFRRFRPTRRIVERLERRAHKHIGKMRTAILLGLFLFVAVPLPGTGAWMGSLIAVVLRLPLRKALPVIAAGVLGAGCIMSALFYLMPGLFTKFFHV